jgi:hypothetical protein
MATNRGGYYNPNFNVLGTEDTDNLSIQTENAGYHEIKIYNETKDKIWLLVEELNTANNLPDLILIAKHLQTLLLKSDTIWDGIKEGANKKKFKMKIQGNDFVYDGIMLKISEQIKRYIKMYEDGNSFISRFKETPPDFINFKERGVSNTTKINIFRDRIQEQVAIATKEWGRLAASINLSMPLVVREERDMFFR